MPKYIVQISSSWTNQNYEVEREFSNEKEAEKYGVDLAASLTFVGVEEIEEYGDVETDDDGFSEED
ncbi:MAG: hypothetical protein CLLPBCKN_006931 [Chroococcidiopsis cubana SAG 39.79]|uniref:Uncharacterized protein n=1 Tax=Chroococcidiopsis cubana SAG 39.79 TaxID=388085 RepID=A0AB37U8T1_9CYAN|nr:hypothetical protein [Chroococcidiopsis cubana]MDZ4877496.1 hypothetical protein [Chroococcidiopsis cubana SAG 39.79]PSB55893.1 hypothetical protein C7B79_32930 [Chroococcidiopsis cubana CCALA 043]RUS95928.1 hypothetical protein DSM107010_70950 [Chroococcidiopsis cubana SAG 39.79]